MAVFSVLHGEPEQAGHWKRGALERRSGSGFRRGPWSLAYVKTYAAWIRRFRGEDIEARAVGAGLCAIGKERVRVLDPLGWVLSSPGAALTHPTPYGLERTIDRDVAIRPAWHAGFELARSCPVVQSKPKINKALSVVNSGPWTSWREREPVASTRSASDTPNTR